MVLLALSVLLIITVLWFLTVRKLRGPDLRAYDGPKLEPINAGSPPSPGHTAAVAQIKELFSGGTGGLGSGGGLEGIRKTMDSMGESADLSDITVIPATADGVPGEWIVAPGSDPNRRLLYIHGGAFTAGSPLSHRPITTAFARRMGFSVFAVDYRLMPEHRRQAGIDDCHRAYRWLFVNGPNCWHQVETLCVAGDSAGGNLALNTAAWTRDHGIRMPDAVVALAPATDSAFESPSMRDNVDTDPLLGPLLRRVVNAPQLLLLWFGWLSARIPPRDPSVSPVRGNLAGLPPTLIHVSEAEMLRDDAYRYFYTAREAGSPVTLQTWDHAIHVWHIFEPSMAEAQQAFDRIETYLAEVVPELRAMPQAVAAG
ncbi:MAG: alpha/beta hydrolase [Pseudomonadota bacterium]